MKSNEIYKFITFIGEAKIGEIILLSFFVFPVILISWLKIFVEIGIENETAKIIIAVALLVLYILAIVYKTILPQRNQNKTSQRNNKNISIQQSLVKNKFQTHKNKHKRNL